MIRRFFPLLVLSLVSVSAHASLTLVPSRAALSAGEDLDLGQFGAATGADLGSSLLGTGSLGTKFLVSSNHLARLDQGTNWYGNFDHGDKLLYNDDYFTNDGSAMTISFAKTLSSVGFNIMEDYYGAFTASITAYDGLGTNLGTVSINGTASGTEGTADFLGVASSNMDIAKIVISSMNPYGHNDFSINHVGINTCDPVPEPASMTALALGAAGLLRRRRKA